MQIEVQENLKTNYCFIHNETVFGFVLEIFNGYSDFFKSNPNIIQENPNGYRIEEHKNDSNLYEKSILHLIDFCQGKKIIINQENIIFLYELAHTFMVPSLIKIINSAISSNKMDFPILNLINLQKDYNADTILYEETISKNLVEYIENDKDDLLLSLHLPIIHRIITSYQTQNPNNEPNSHIMNFLFKCLKKFGRPASVLFEKVKIGNENSEYLRALLSDEYSSNFDFHFINGENHKTIYDIQTSMILEKEKIKQQQTEIMNLMMKNQLKNSEEIKNIEASFTDNLSKMKEEITKEKDLQIKQLKDSISIMTVQLQKLQDQNASLTEKVNQLEGHHNEFERRILTNNMFPLTRVFLTMGGKDQNGVKSYASRSYNIPESVIHFVPSSISGNLRWDAENYRLYVGSAGQYLITGKVSLYGMKLGANMNLLILHNDGGSDYRISQKPCNSGDLYTNYVPAHYTIMMNSNDYLTFLCNVTNNEDKTCTIPGGSTVYTMIEVTRIA